MKKLFIFALFLLSFSSFATEFTFSSNGKVSTLKYDAATRAASLNEEKYFAHPEESILGAGTKIECDILDLKQDKEMFIIIMNTSEKLKEVMVEEKMTALNNVDCKNSKALVVLVDRKVGSEATFCLKSKPAN